MRGLTGRFSGGAKRRPLQPVVRRTGRTHGLSSAARPQLIAEHHRVSAWIVHGIEHVTITFPKPAQLRSGEAPSKLTQASSRSSGRLTRRSSPRQQ